jgi:dihydroneopterin aldolase
VPNTPSAFSSLETRAEHLKSDKILDRISLREHLVDVEIGAFQVERDVLQRVNFNIVVELMPLPKDLGDDVDRILSYDTLAEAVQIELAAERLNLLETLAERVGDRILNEPQAVRVFVRIEKLDRGPGALGVEIVRSVADIAPRELLAETPAIAPVVVHVSRAAQNAPSLNAWIEALKSAASPIVLTVDAPQIPSGSDERLQDEAAQRHIELLELEQVAWRLAAQQPHCTVRGSRTELDWAVKQGLMSVWAPSKMVLDAVISPAGTALDLAGWLANELGARELIVLGEELPEDCNIAMRALDPAGLIPLF